MIAANGAARLGEAYASTLGFDYRVWSSDEINWILQRNLQFLDDYLRCDPLGAAVFVDPAIKTVVEETPGILLRDLLEKAVVFQKLTRSI